MIPPPRSSIIPPISARRSVGAASRVSAPAIVTAGGAPVRQLFNTTGSTRTAPPLGGVGGGLDHQRQQEGKAVPDRKSVV